MNIPEYYMYEAERADNGELVQGYYELCGVFIDTIEEEIYPIIKEFYGLCHKVKPETVRRVAVKPLKNEMGDIFCPNCQITFDKSGDIYNGKADYREDKFCRRCGMAIDWSQLKTN